MLDQNIKNRLAKDGYKIVLDYINKLEREIEALTLERESSTQIDAKILKKLLRTRDDNKN